jgi:metal-responsive CopG/Arc/MetJ family transcriptional regulator
MSKLAKPRRVGRPLSGSTRLNIALEPPLIKKIDRLINGRDMTRNEALRAVINALPADASPPKDAGKVNNTLIWAFDKDGSFVCADLLTKRSAYAYPTSTTATNARKPGRVAAIVKGLMANENELCRDLMHTATLKEIEHADSLRIAFIRKQLGESA